MYSALRKAAQKEESVVQDALNGCEDRMQTIEKAAKEIEVDVYSFCASEMGYAQGCRRVQRGLRLLELPETRWTEFDEDERDSAKGALDSLRRACA